MRTWHFLNYLHEDLTIWPAWGPAYLLYDLHEDLTIFFMTCMRTWLSSTEYDLHEDHIIFYMTYMKTWLVAIIYSIWPAWGPYYLLYDLHEDLAIIYSIWPAWGPYYLLYDLHEDLAIIYSIWPAWVPDYLTCMRTVLMSTAEDECFTSSSTGVSSSSSTAWQQVKHVRSCSLLTTEVFINFWGHSIQLHIERLMNFTVLKTRTFSAVDHLCSVARTMWKITEFSD